MIQPINGGRAPARMGAYFALYFALEWAAEEWLLPPDAFGMEVAYVCFGIAGLFAVASLVARRMERESDRGE